MKYIFILGLFIVELFATPVTTQLSEEFYTGSFEKIIRFDTLHFTDGVLDTKAQDELDAVIEQIEKLQKEKKEFIVTVVGHKYDADKYYPQKNKNNLAYTIEEKNALDDKSAKYAQRVFDSLKKYVDESHIVTVAKDGYYMANTDEDQSSADLSNRVMVSLYLVTPKDVDSDGDGVFDRFDRCEKTPAGVKVDKNGCPVDSDGDGVLDYQDKCPNTSPKGIIVDADGCPLDSDNDGVIDYKDRCENTPEGLEVDPHGCPLKQTLKLFFKRGSAKIMPESYGEIKKFAEFLANNPAYKVKITGHTDSRGKAEKNMKLSLERAEAVKKALELEGIDAKRIITAGRGELDPIASNRTKEGRAKNRRIEIELFQ
ncbi:MAG: OmpA family protein [Sulfurimonas sp.]